MRKRGRCFTLVIGFLVGPQIQRGQFGHAVFLFKILNKMKNINKFNSYSIGFKILAEAEVTKSLPLSIAAIAIAESIIADRCTSFLNFKEKAVDNKKFISTSKLLKDTGKYYKNLSMEIRRKKGELFKTDDLFTEALNWLNHRNTIIHSIAKSHPGTPTMEKSIFEDLAYKTAVDGLKYASLIKKWHRTELIKNTHEIKSIPK
jgi:hypothetical protein